MQAGAENNDRHQKRGHGVGLRQHPVQGLWQAQRRRQPDGQNAGQHHGRGQNIRGKMQGVGLQGLTFIAAGHPAQDAHAVDIHGHGNGHDAHAPK